MSVTTLLYINKYNDLLISTDAKVLENSWGSAPVVWEAMYSKYYHPKDPWGYWHNSLEKMWDYWKKPSIPRHIRAVFMMTFDKVYILKKDYQQAADDIDRFIAEHPPKAGHANHWEDIAGFLRSCKAPAFGIWHTSVSENPFIGDWNYDTDAYDPPPWEYYYSLYDELDALEVTK